MLWFLALEDGRGGRFDDRRRGGYGGGYGGGYYTAMPAPLFPRLAFMGRNRNVAPPVVMTVVARPMPVVSTPIFTAPAPAGQILASTNAGTQNAEVRDGGGQ